MEFLRFGSSIPGEYWGCCACDIIQNFKQDPDTPASIQLVSGDGGGPLTHPEGGFMYAGPTLRDIFWQRLRVGTFNGRDMPNHMFLAILEHSQIAEEGSIGHKWLAILKEAGFEFIRCVDNSVYTGPDLKGVGDFATHRPHKNYLFGLFRNIGNGACSSKEMKTPPDVWKELPENKLSQKEIWETKCQASLLNEAGIVAAGAPVIMAGLRSICPPQLKETREEVIQPYKDKGLAFASNIGTVSYSLYKKKLEPVPPPSQPIAV